ncbi:hypothetical protein [Ferruginibacter sp.]
MTRQQSVKRFIALMLCTYCLLKNVHAQTGSFTATFTPADVTIKPVTLSISKPAFKFDNPHGYWFVNPHNGYKHFNTQPDQGYSDRKEEQTGIAFISFNQTENDFDFYALNDSISISLQKNKSVISAPKYDPKIGDKNKPLHIHIASINAVEITFTLSGAAELSSTEGYAKPSMGTISGTGHFFRDPQYAKSDPLPGCDCDPTIYASVIDDANWVRTPSACEKAFNNKLFDAVQKTMSPLFDHVDHKDNISITILPGSANINVPVQDRPYCSSDYYHNGLTGLDAEKKLFSSDDRFGVRFIRTLSNEAMGITPNTGASSKAGRAKMDSLYKLAAAKKISMEEYSRQIQAAMTNMAGNENIVDVKKLEAENNLYITVIINPGNKTQTELKLADKNKTVVTHTVKGAAFEIFSPIVKDGDGTWLRSRMAVYFGKFSAPVMGKSGGGFAAETTNAAYPARQNKLSVYNIIIKMEGGKDLMDKALANMDLDALQNLITKQ